MLFVIASDLILSLSKGERGNPEWLQTASRSGVEASSFLDCRVGFASSQ